MASRWDYDDPEDLESAARDYAAADLTEATVVDIGGTSMVVRRPKRRPAASLRTSNTSLGARIFQAAVEGYDGIGRMVRGVKPGDIEWRHPESSQTPLHAACARKPPISQSIAHLMIAGAEADAVDRRGYTPLMHLCYNYSIGTGAAKRRKSGF